MTGKNIDVRPDYDGNNRDIAVELVLDMDIRSYKDNKKDSVVGYICSVRNHE